jgi:hypothetical protein
MVFLAQSIGPASSHVRILHRCKVPDTVSFLVDRLRRPRAAAPRYLGTETLTHHLVRTDMLLSRSPKIQCRVRPLLHLLGPERSETADHEQIAAAVASSDVRGRTGANAGDFYSSTSPNLPVTSSMMPPGVNLMPSAPTRRQLLWRPSVRDDSRSAAGINLIRPARALQVGDPEIVPM